MSKSTVLNLVESGIKSTAGEDVIIVRFDAWLYQGFDDSRAALMEVIGTRLLAAAESSLRVGRPRLQNVTSMPL